VATDWLLVGSTFTFVLTATFNILGFEFLFEDSAEATAKSLFYFVVGIFASFMCGWIMLSSDVAMMRPTMWIFWFLGIMDFIIVLVRGLMAMKIWKDKQRGWRE